MTRSARSNRRPLRTSIVVGLVLVVLVLAAGVGLAVTQHKAFTAESVLVVLPRADLDEATSAAFYETMSRGQIVGTFAEVANNVSFQNEALGKLTLSDQERASVSTVVSVVPNTSVILVRVTADTADTAEQGADGIAGLTTTYLTTLSDAFRTQVVHSAAGSAESSGLSPALVLMLAAVAAITLGVAAQQAVYHLIVARRLTTPDDPATATSPAAAAEPVEGTGQLGQA